MRACVANGELPGHFWMSMNTGMSMSMSISINNYFLISSLLSFSSLFACFGVAWRFGELCEERYQEASFLHTPVAGSGYARLLLFVSWSW